MFILTHSKTICHTKPVTWSDCCVLGAGVQTPADTKHAVIVTPGVTAKQGIGQGTLALKILKMFPNVSSHDVIYCLPDPVGPTRTIWGDGYSSAEEPIMKRAKKPSVGRIIMNQWFLKHYCIPIAAAAVLYSLIFKFVQGWDIFEFSHSR